MTRQRDGEGPRDFYLHEDDWGMIALEPIENLGDRREVVAEAAAHAEEHRAPGGLGFTALYVAPAARVSISIRGLTLDALAATLGSAYTRYESMTSGYSTYREDVMAGFAFRRGEARYLDTVYGTVKDGVIVDLNLARVSRASRDTLMALGSAFRLMICDLWCEAAIDLCNHVEVERYLALVDPEDAPGDDDGG